MKLRAITLRDVRRFTGQVRIDGIDDGVNVLSAPNEYGKSTVFDALRAVFFAPHGSRGKEVAQLRPHAGGAPEVCVEIETPDGVFRVSKRWFGKPEARVTCAGALVAQADAAEAWIARLLGGGDGGPSGLLWVRQGLISLADGSNKEQQAARDARRDLLSSVTGEVEAMTGGRRMDAALARCREELAIYATPTGRPRTGGAWVEALQDIDALGREREDLASRVVVLQAALSERTRLRRELREITAPDAAAERKARVEAAHAAHEAAKAHEAQLDTAAKALQAAITAENQARNDLSALRTVTKDHALALEKEVEAKARLEAAQGALAACETAFAEVAAVHDAAKGTAERADDILRRARARAAAAAANERRAELKDRLVKAGSARRAAEAAKAEAAVGPDDADMDRLRALASALTTARALRDSTATRVVMRYAPGMDAGVRCGETALRNDMVLPIHADTVLRLADLGDLTIHPGEGPEGLSDVAGAETNLAKAFRALGVASMDAAAHAHRKRKDAADRLAGVRAELAVLAPKGIEDLQRQLAALPDQAAADDNDGLTEVEAEAALQAASGHEAELAAVREAVRERRDGARTALAEALVRQEAADERLQGARAALARLATQDEAELAMRADLAAIARETAAAALDRIRAMACDITGAAAALKRARSVEEAARQRVDHLRPAIAALNERIAGNAGEAVEERLQETEEKLEVARAHLASVDREVKVLQRLMAALENARSEARDRYFEPIAGELRPLLHLLWPDAELNWADDTLLPQSLIRNGQVESVDILSGGTQEQIAFLVRLAFARLLARRGQHAPLILDDALVFTDDDRIERMFDALHRQAGDLQIIVLSCRQRAFRDLGGKALKITAEGG